jgi:AbrB family looped-hinge helix DNA binding protein
MQAVKVSPKFQVVIPAAFRKSLHILPGKNMRVLCFDGRLEFIPEEDAKSIRGMAKGINTTVVREKDRL